MNVGNPEKPGGALRANDRGVRQIADTMPVLTCTLTAQFDVELATQALLDYFGVTLDELKNWVSIGVVHPTVDRRAEVGTAEVAGTIRAQ